MVKDLSIIMIFRRSLTSSNLEYLLKKSDMVTYPGEIASIEGGYRTLEVDVTLNYNSIWVQTLALTF